MKYLLPLLLLVSGCNIIPTTGDIRRVADELDAFKAGAQTKEETVAALDELEAEISSRETPIPTSIPELLVLLATMGTAAAGGVVTTNRIRDGRRKMGTDVQKTG